MKKLFLIFNFSFLIFNYSHAQPVIQWQKCLGGTFNEGANSVQQTADGGYIVAGFSLSLDGDVTGNHGSQDFWLVKLNSSGNIQWQKCLGGTGGESAYSIQQTADGGYIVAGTASSYNGDVTGYHGGSAGDYWVVKLDGSGNIQWQKCLGGTGTEWAQYVQQTVDGGYVVAGWTQSNDGDVTGNHDTTGFYKDYWIVKLNGSGNIQWQKCAGGTVNDEATSIEEAAGGGYIVAGYTSSNNGDVIGNHGNADYWVMKLDSSGNIQWQKCLGGTNAEKAYALQQTADGGYIVAGYTQSNNGDVTGNHDTTGSYFDNWVVKLDSSGNIQWQKCLGGTWNEQGNSVQQTADGGYIVAGYANSNDGDVTGIHSVGFYDYWVVKLDNSGNIQWQKCLGGIGYDYGYSVRQTADGGYIVAGYTSSNDGDVSGFHGGTYDYWVVKLSSITSTDEEPNNGAYNIFPNPFTAHAVISFGSPVYNATFSLYSLLGEKVKEATGINGESFQFNRGNLQSGVYVFEVREKEKSIARGKAAVVY